MSAWVVSTGRPDAVDWTPRSSARAQRASTVAPLPTTAQDYADLETSSSVNPVGPPAACSASEPSGASTLVSALACVYARYARSCADGAPARQGSCRRTAPMASLSQMPSIAIA